MAMHFGKELMEIPFREFPFEWGSDGLVVLLEGKDSFLEGLE